MRIEFSKRRCSGLLLFRWDEERVVDGFFLGRFLRRCGKMDIATPPLVRLFWQLL